MKISRLTWVIVIALLLAAGAAELGGRWWAQMLEPSYTQVEERLYIGGKVGKPPEGTSAVLNLSKLDDSYRSAVYNWQPTADGLPVPTLDWLNQQVRFIDAQRQAGRTVFVHCDAGNSRSGMVVAAYLMWQNGWPRDRSLEYLRTKRPTVRPNPAFLPLLTEWEKQLQLSMPVPSAETAPRG